MAEPFQTCCSRRRYETREHEQAPGLQRCLQHNKKSACAHCCHGDAFRYVVSLTEFNGPRETDRLLVRYTRKLVNSVSQGCQEAFNFLGTRIGKGFFKARPRSIVLAVRVSRREEGSDRTGLVAQAGRFQDDITPFPSPSYQRSV